MTAAEVDHRGEALAGFVAAHGNAGVLHGYG